MRARAIALLLALAGLAPACTAPAPRGQLAPTVILVSLDGFAARFLQAGVTPTIARLAAEGVHAPLGTVPVFPTKTFPNHYSIVTGVYPERHGIVANSMYDPVFDATFTLSDRDAVSDGRWWGAEPLWVSAETQGQVAAPFFWPGSEAEIAGVRPTFWERFDDRMPNDARVRHVLSWLDLPDDQRPTFLTLYFSDVDSDVHDHGVDSREARAALRRVDAAVGQLLHGLEARGIADQVNIVIVADHGMADIAPDRVIFLDDYLDLSAVRVTAGSPLAAIWPAAGEEERVYRALLGAGLPWSVYRRAEIPARLHHRDHRRIAPILAVADEGWSIARRASFVPARYEGATHGYDNALGSMRALFVARGPALTPGLVVPPFQNIHVYELLAAILGLRPAPNDGSLDSVRVMLRP